MGVVEGAASGAAMGSVVPGIGTVAGGVVGGVLGLFGGDDDPPPPPPPPRNGVQYSDKMWGGTDDEFVNGQRIDGTSGADLDVTRYRNMGEAAAGRGAYQINYGQANRSLNNANGDLSRANSDRVSANQDRQQQIASAALMRDAAYGNAPSKAELLGRSMIDQSLQAQLAGAASARGGPMAQAAAQRQAANGAAAFQQQGGQQLAAMRADEMERARGAWMQGLTGMRGQDYAGADQATRMAQMRSGMAQTQAQMQQAQAQSEMNQRQLNQQAQMHYEDSAFGVRQAALNAGLGEQGQNDARQAHRDEMNAKERGEDMDLAAAGIGAVATIGAHALASGGPMEANKPYLVGERGPELVLPARDGIVVPAEQTPQVLALYEPEGKRLQQSLDGHGYLADDAPADDGRPSLASKSPSLAHAATAKARAKQPATHKARPLTPDELRAAADKMEAQMRADHVASMAQGPAARRLSGGTPENGFTTELTSGAEDGFQRWAKETAPWDTGADYDLRGAYAEGIDRDSRGHLPDTYKKPNHETFSDESAYAPYGEPGHWVGEHYFPPKRLPPMGGRADPYSQPSMGQAASLMGGREDPYR